MRTHARNPAPKKIRSPAEETLARERVKNALRPRHPEFAPVFDALRDVMAVHAASLDVRADEPGHYALNSIKPDGKHDRYFGDVTTEESHVSFHLYPLFMFPELADGISRELEARMHGRYCFHFTRVEPELFAELARLTARGFEEMKRRDLI